MSHSNKQRQVPLLTEGELHNTTQQNEMSITDEWASKAANIASTVSEIRASFGFDSKPHSTHYAVGRRLIENAQFEVGIDMIKVRMSATSMKVNPEEVFGPEFTSLLPDIPVGGFVAGSPRESRMPHVIRIWSAAFHIFESPVRVTVRLEDGVYGVVIYCEFNPSHVRNEQRIRPATVSQTYSALEALDELLRPFFNGLNHRWSWDIYRLDLTVDFTPDGPTHEIHSQALKSFRRGSGKLEQYFGKKGVIETTECRTKKAGSLRLYDKRRQMKAVYGVEIGSDLMRIEYQMMRPALRDKIRTVGNLTEELAHFTMESRIKFFIKRLQREVASTEIVINEEQ
jgi:hypothetical protein